MLLFDTLHERCHVSILIEHLLDAVVHALALVLSHLWLIVGWLHTVFEAVVSEVEHELVPFLLGSYPLEHLKGHPVTVVWHIDLSLSKSRLTTSFHISTYFQLINLMLHVNNQIIFSLSCFQTFTA